MLALIEIEVDELIEVRFEIEAEMPADALCNKLGQ
jgi:hypothetical protein